MPTTTLGFTLVELAIALMVIGLLIGGVLKGQELIENARITALIRDLKSYETATRIFQSSYGAIPGDIRNPGTRLSNCTLPYCAQSGNGDGHITYVHEADNYYVHMNKAGLINETPGNETVASVYDDQESFVPNKLNDLFIFIGYSFNSTDPRYNSVNRDTHFFNLETESETINQLSAKQAAQIDRKTDDGNPFSGGAFSWDDEDCIVDDAYNESNRSARCEMRIDAGF